MSRKPEVDKYKYVLSWITESVSARQVQIDLIVRANNAYQGNPTHNYYREQIEKAAGDVAQIDSTRSRELKKIAADIPQERNFTVQDAVETVVSMAQGGVGRYEFGPYDPDMDKDDEVVDRLGSAAKFFYNNEKIDALMPQFIRTAVLGGESTLLLSPKGDQKKVVLLDNDQVLNDPRRVKLNRERFIGFHQRESWRTLKASLGKNRGGAFLKSINEVDTYLSQILMLLNNPTSTPMPGDSTGYEAAKRDLDVFYKDLPGEIEEYRKTDPEYLYNGDEIERAYIYDKENGMYFEVINRRFIIVGKANDLKRTIKFDAIQDDGTTKQATKLVKLDDPFVQLGYKKLTWNRYPVTPLFDQLDEFDKLCSMESVMAHNLSIMAPLTFIGQSSDAEKVARVASISGEIVEGLPQTFGVMGKSHDMSAIITAIQRKEDRIKRALGATDQFQMAAILGDRASAKEVTSMSGQVSQALNPLLANIEAAMSILGDKFIKMQLIYNKGAYDFTHNGKYSTLDEEDMAGDYEIQAKLISAIKLEQASNSQHAVQLIQFMGQLDAIEKKEFFGTLIPIVMAGTVSREQAAKMITPEYRPMDEEMMASIKAKAEADAKRHPVDKLDLSQYSGPELDDMIQQMSSVSGNPNQYFDGQDEPYVPTPAAGPTGEPINPTTAAPTQAPPDSNVVINGAPVQPDVQPGSPTAGAPPSTAPASGDPSTAGELANDPSMVAA